MSGRWLVVALAVCLPFAVSVGGSPPSVPVVAFSHVTDSNVVSALRGTADFAPYWTSPKFEGRRYILMTMTLDSSRGYILKAHRLAFGPLLADGYMSQADLAALSGVSATKISRVERALDTLTVAQQDSVALAFIRIMRARVHPYAVEQFNAIVLRNLSRP